MGWQDAAILSVLAVADLSFVLYLRHRRMRRSVVERAVSRSLRLAIRRKPSF